MTLTDDGLGALVDALDRADGAAHRPLRARIAMHPLRVAV